VTEDAFHELGTVIDEAEAMRLGSTQTRHLAEACRRHDDFEIVAFRHLGMQDDEPVIALEVICDNRRVTAFNTSGIRPVERLLLSWWPRARRPSVRALRKDFPRLLHQNAVPADEPASLCLYAQDPADVARALTPERHLEHILTWLARSAEGTLHAPDQELEGLFYTGGTRLFLPADFGQLTHRPLLSFEGWWASGIFVLRPRASKPGAIDVPALVVWLPPVPHVPMAHVPQTLGEFASAMGTAWAIDIEGALRAALTNAYPPGQLHPYRAGDIACIVFVIPRVREAGALPERVDCVGMLMSTTPEDLAREMGILTLVPSPQAWVVDTHLGGATDACDAWRQRRIDAIVPAQQTLDRHEAQRLSGISPALPMQPRVLAGAGALGSAMLNHWIREGLGPWTVLDDDLVMPHNLVRHTATDAAIGRPKAEVVAKAANAVWTDGEDVRALPGCIGALTDEGEAALREAALVVDATTSIRASRRLGHADGIGRCATVFLTPNGLGSVLMMESADRAVRLGDLETAYYRAILHAPWGATHLATAGHMRTGHGCRDASLVLSGEVVGLHAALLARQVRLAATAPQARLTVWGHDAATGAVGVHPVAPPTASRVDADGWAVHWDAEVEARMLALRASHLPSETGGILLGCVDVEARTLRVVEACPAPPDSIATPASFVRGRSGVAACVAEARRRTQHEVDYIGEWHSHPNGALAVPSTTDRRQLSELAERLAAEGLPVLQGIAGLNDAGLPSVHWSVDWQSAAAQGHPAP
jgi:integrative and conjugative element protein (TIGR02256 family)